MTDSDEASRPDISVIMPTWNRIDVLPKTFEVWAEEAGRFSGRFELIVVNDASPDASADVIRDAVASAPYPIKSLANEVNSGASVARNKALDVAEGDILIFVGDDTWPEPGFLDAHLDWHRRQHPGEHEMLQGLIRWSDEMPDTPFIRWLELKGSQFAFEGLKDGQEVNYGLYYTSNCSLKRAFAERTGVRFDPDLRLMEDNEYARELCAQGGRIYFSTAPLVSHYHPTTLQSSLARMRRAGHAAAQLERMSGEHFDRITAGLYRPENATKRRVVELALSEPMAKYVYAPLAALCERRVFVDRIFAAAHASALYSGLQAKRRDMQK